MANLPDQQGLPVTIGRYQVTARLASYAESGVYHAVDPLLERRLIIKVFSLDGIRAQAAADVRTKFFDEIRRVGMLTHSGLVTIFDAGEVPSGLFIAAEHVEGTTLAEWLAAHPDCPLTERVSIITQIAEALEHVHGQGQAHLGLRPSNVFVTADRTLRVAGLGIAPVLDALQRARGDEVPAAGASPAAPASDRLRDARADVRALGDMTRTLLSPEECDAAVAAVLAQATAADPEARFPSAAPFAEALLASLGLSDLHVRIAWEIARSGGAFVDEPTSGPLEISPLEATRLPDCTETRLEAGAVTQQSGAPEFRHPPMPGPPLT